ncbi:Flp pilus assembly protein CpaB [Siminovitchia sediminis]|uniref:Flp pilus assembly protein CpaB n=1 Tax=Siminovitchia sediminis TaxID=1274353 RepID=A0ABW4KLG6_9BACI
MKMKKIWMLALISGVITTFLFYHFMSKASAEPKEETITVITAAADMKKNEKITEEMLSLSDFPKSAELPGAIQNKEEILGKYTSASIKQGEMILRHRIEQVKDEDTVVSKKVKPGYRAVSVQAEYVESVSNLIEPEDKVDVIVSRETGQANKIDTEIVKEEVRVLSVGQRMIEANGAEARGEYHAVTLEVNKEDAVKIINESRQGHLQLVLHSKRSQEATEASPDNANIISLPHRSAVRSGPGLKEPILSIVDKGTELDMTGEQATDQEERIWIQVRTIDGTEGWISSRIIKLEDE